MAGRAPLNETAAEALRESLRSARFHPTLLFYGPRGSGRRETALWLARVLNCAAPEERRPCGECVPCGKIARGAHVDVRVIEPDGANVTIEQARGVREEAAFRPFEGRWRVFVFPQAERFNAESANALLKTLEEPAGTTCLVLCAPAPEALLATIRSRCRAVRFPPLPVRIAQKRLRESLGVSEEEARVLAFLTGGDAAPAASLEKGRVLEERDAALSLLEALAGIEGSPSLLLEWVEPRARKKSAGKDREEGETETRAAEGERPEGGGPLDDRLRLGLLLLATILRDALRLAAGAPPAGILVHEGNAARRIAAVAGRGGAAPLAVAVRRVEEARRDLDRFASRRIAAESLLVDLRGLLSARAPLRPADPIAR